MATRNDQKVAETAEALLDKIKSSAEKYTTPADVLALAQAFALVAEHDPRATKERSGAVWSG